MNAAILKSPELILASTSTYRAELLARLQLPFRAVAPAVDETAGPKDTPQRLPQRLALAKAQAVAQQFPHAWVIGSDQIALCAGQVLGKPGTVAAAQAQLKAMSGQRVAFITGLAVVHAASGKVYRAVDTTVVQLRKLSRAEITRYIAREPALDCAGSAKIEGLGIALTQDVHSRDPTALIGLPLIATARLLRKAGYCLP